MKVNKVGHTYFAIVENFLTTEECKSLIDSVPEWNLTKVPAGTYNGWQTGVQLRDIGVPDVEWQKKFNQAFNHFNNMTYRFNLLHQYSHFCNRYKAGMVLDWHRDEDESVKDLYKRTPANRLSASVFLNESFEGGEFELEGIGYWKARTGTAIFFPSGQVHRGREVTAGMKYNYTIWRKGERGA